MLGFTCIVLGQKCRTLNFKRGSGITQVKQGCLMGPSMGCKEVHDDFKARGTCYGRRSATLFHLQCLEAAYVQLRLA